MQAQTLTRLAATARPETLVAAKAALKSAGLKQSLARELLNQETKLRGLRATAKADRVARHLGYSRVDAKAYRSFLGGQGARVKGGIGVPHLPRPTGRSAVCLPAGTLTQRLTEARKSAVLETLGKLIERHEHGAWVVKLTDNPAEVGMQTRQYYTGKHAGKWAIRATDTTITVPSAWRARVLRKGLALCGDMMTLDAAPLEATGCELFAATWARRTGAKNVSVDKGYIARLGGVEYHGATPDAAIAGLTRKTRAIESAARLASADLSLLVARCPGALVSVGDAAAIGACDYGIRSWCAAVGLPYAAGSATLGEVYDAYKREPRPEARATILHVLRRHRALRDF